MQAFLRFLQEVAPAAQQLYLLGDIFEYWAGDDDLPAQVNSTVAEALAALAAKGCAISWIAGNRDFLAGEQFASAARLRLLPDPWVLDGPAYGRLILTHGDALCTDDHGYMQLRAVLRSSDWQKEFLSKPLDIRKQMIAHMREQSRAAQRGKTYEIMDVNQDAVQALATQEQASRIIHGHTHRPALHHFACNDRDCERHVLPDWDVDTESKEQSMRGGWISLASDGTLTHHGSDSAEFKRLLGRD